MKRHLNQSIPLLFMSNVSLTTKSFRGLAALLPKPSSRRAASAEVWVIKDADEANLRQDRILRWPRRGIAS